MTEVSLPLGRLPKTCTACGAPGRWRWSESSAEWFFEREPTAAPSATENGRCACDGVMWNPYNKVVQCHRCGRTVDTSESHAECVEATTKAYRRGDDLEAMLLNLVHNASNFRGQNPSIDAALDRAEAVLKQQVSGVGSGADVTGAVSATAPTEQSVREELAPASAPESSDVVESCPGRAMSNGFSVPCQKQKGHVDLCGIPLDRPVVDASGDVVHHVRVHPEDWTNSADPWLSDDTVRHLRGLSSGSLTQAEVNMLLNEIEILRRRPAPSAGTDQRAFRRIRDLVKHHHDSGSAMDAILDIAQERLDVRGSTDRAGDES